MTMIRMSLLASLLAGCASRPSDNADGPARRCEQLREHLVELRIAETRGAVDRAAHTKALHRALGAEFIDACTTRLSQAEVTCALAANTPASAAGCSQTPTHEGP